MDPFLILSILVGSSIFSCVSSLSVSATVMVSRCRLTAAQLSLFCVSGLLISDYLTFFSLYTVAAALQAASYPPSPTSSFNTAFLISEPLSNQFSLKTRCSIRLENAQTPGRSWISGTGWSSRMFLVWSVLKKQKPVISVEL